MGDELAQLLLFIQYLHLGEAKVAVNFTLKRLYLLLQGHLIYLIVYLFFHDFIWLVLPIHLHLLLKPLCQLLPITASPKQRLCLVAWVVPLLLCLPMESKVDLLLLDVVLDVLLGLIDVLGVKLELFMLLLHLLLFEGEFVLVELAADRLGEGFCLMLVRALGVAVLLR